MCVVSKLHLESSKTFVWKRCCPMKLLLRYSTTPSFSEVLFDRLQRYPLPWTAVVYHDEVTPGNALRPANNRKFHAFYFSFLELGLHLRQETSWLPFAMIRSSIVKQVIGGISSVVASLLKESFDCPGGYRCELNVMGRRCLMTAVFGHPVKSSPVKKMSSSSSPKQIKAKQSKAKWTVEPPQDLIKKFAEGCSSCRNVKGCTPSCWRKRGF